MPTVIIFNVRNPTLSPGTGRLSHASHDRCVVYYMWWPNAWCSYIARIREISLSKAHQHRAAKCRRQRGLPDSKHVICITYGTKSRIFKKTTKIVPFSRPTREEHSQRWTVWNEVSILAGRSEWSTLNILLLLNYPADTWPHRISWNIFNLSN